MRCSSCKLLQLRDKTNIEDQYTDYLYFTSTTNNLASYYAQVADKISFKTLNTTNRPVVDIGSNDGTFLKKFHSKGIQVVGVEPSRPASKKANDNGIFTINDFFSKEIAREIKKDFGCASLVSLNYTLANVPALNEMLDCIRIFADENTFLSIITGYHIDQFQVNMFDYIGHDHLTYFSLRNLSEFLEKHNWKIINAERVEHKGGSIALLAVPSSSALIPESSVWQLLQRETWLGADGNETILRMFSELEKSRSFMNSFLSTYRKEEVIGIGASISTTYFSNYFDISEKISLLLDDDFMKIGRFSPGSGIQVESLGKAKTYAGKTAIMLAWQHTDRLLTRLREEGFRGLILIPLPRPYVLRI